MREMIIKWKIMFCVEKKKDENNLPSSKVISRREATKKKQKRDVLGRLECRRNAVRARREKND